MSKINKNYDYSFVNRASENEKFEEEQIVPAPKLGYRHVQVLLYFLLCFIAFAFRVSLSVGIVAMTDPKISRNPEIPTYPEWKDKNVIFSAFFWGYVLPQVFAGWIVGRLGAKWFLIGTFSIQSLLGVLTPFTAAQFGSRGMMLSRAIQGLTQGFIYPSLTHLLSKWAPIEERSRLGTIVYASGTCGTVVTILVTGLISASWYGWPLVFYLNGALGFIWVIFFLIFGYDSPAAHPHISKSEKLYIETSLGHSEDSRPIATPWKSIFTSLPVWALFVTQAGNNYCFWTLITQIPSYMNYVMNFDIKENSLLSSLPYLTLWLMSFLVGYSSDQIVNRGLLKRTVSRKIFNSLGLMVPAVALIILAYTKPDQSAQAVALLTVAVGCNALVFAGWNLNHMDLSPNHSGTLMGLCNGLSQTTGAVAPLIVQLIVTDEADPLQWRTVFLVTAASNVVTSAFFALFGTAKVQPWND